jgi:hypothetical protein
MRASPRDGGLIKRVESKVLSRRGHLRCCWRPGLSDRDGYKAASSARAERLAENTNGETKRQQWAHRRLHDRTAILAFFVDALQRGELRTP